MSGGGTIVNETPRISALRIQTSCNGTTIGVVLGRQRATGNLIFYDDLKAIRHEENQSGGKGGGPTMQSVSYTYRYSLQVGIAEGPATVGEIWMQAGGEKIKLSENPQYGYSINSGNVPNSYSSVLAARHPDKFFHYPGLCNFTAVDLGEFSGDTPPSFSFEVTGYDYDDTIGGADPANSIHTIITNKRWGAAGPESAFPVATNYGNYAVAMGFAIGLEMAEQKPAADWVQTILDQTNAAAVWAADHLEIVPWGDEAVSGNGRTWTPNVTPIYDLTDDDFMGDPADLIRTTRKADSEAFNIRAIEFRNRSNEYNIETVDGDDPADVAMYGPKKDRDSLIAHGIGSPDVAKRLGDLVVQRGLRTLNTYEFELPWKFCRLVSMDIVTLTNGPLGMDKYPVRLTKVVDTPEMTIQCTAEDFPAGAGHAPLIPRQTPAGYNRDFNADPGNSATPVIIEPPVALSGQPEMWLGTTGGDTWGGANVWMSIDGTAYKYLGRTRGGARIGVTTSALPLVADPDSTSTLGVNLTISRGSLIGVSAVDRDAFATLSYVGGELIAFKDAALVGANAYNLSSLRRGAYGSPVAAHASGVPFMRLDEAVFKYAYDPALIGKTIYIKLQSYNIFGGAVQDIETITPTAYTIAGAPMGKVSGLALVQAWDGPDCSVKWIAQPSAASYTMEVWAGGVKRRTVTGITSTGYTYTLADNKADGGPRRSVEFRLYGIAPNGASTEPAILTAANAQIDAPSGVATAAAGKSLSVSANRPTAIDYAGTKIWISTTSGFDPATTTPAYNGPDWYYSALNLTGGNYYVRVGHYDIFGTDGMNISSETTLVVIGADGGIPVVPDASTITTLKSDAYWAVMDATTGKIWRWNAATSHYTKASDGSDLAAASVAADKIAVSQLSAITANLGAMTSGSITIDAAGFVRGGSTGYLTGNGFWLGYHSGYYKMHVGNPSGAGFTWDGGAFRIRDSSGTVILQSGVGTGSDGLSWSAVIGSGKPADNATVGAQVGTNLTAAGGGLISGVVSNQTPLTSANQSTYIQSLQIGDGSSSNITVSTAQFSLDGDGNAVFSGALQAATGTFSGSLSAGVLDASAFDAIVNSYSAPGTYSLTIPAKKDGWTSMNMRVTIQGAGGGGAASLHDWEISGAGGGAGQRQVFTVANVTPGNTLSITVGAGGAGGQSNGANGAAGAASSVAGIGSAAGGGGTTHPGQPWDPFVPGSLGGHAAIAGANGYSFIGGNGGSSEFGAGGVASGVGGNGGNGGIGAGGAGGGLDMVNLSFHRGGDGGPGRVQIEFFDPNMIVLNTRYAALVSWLDTIGHGSVPTTAR